MLTKKMSGFSRVISVVLGSLGLFWALQGCSSRPLMSPSARPRLDHLVVMVFDAMRPDYIDRFDLKNFKALRARSQNYSQGYLGYMGSETVVSHMVIPTGRLPKDLPWQDNVLWDVNGKWGDPGAFVSTGGLKGDQFFRALSELPQGSLLGNILKKHFGGKTFAVAQKHYAAHLFGTPAADSVVTLKRAGDFCEIDGRALPSYLQKNDRYRLNCKPDYGTGMTYYPLDGNRFVPGDDAKHLGGDIWVADVALDLMRNENWSGLFLSFGAIDKVAHMLGEPDGKSPVVSQSQFHLEDVARIADAQLGRILQKLKDDHLEERTLIVITADHGGQTDYQYLGTGRESGVWDATMKAHSTPPPPWVWRYTQKGRVRFSFQDSAIRIWLQKKDQLSRSQVVAELKRVPGLTEIFQLHQNPVPHYSRIHRNFRGTTQRFQSWAKLHSLEIVNAMATAHAPDLVGLLNDRVGFELVGEHGGAQENVQRVPMLFLIPGEPGREIPRPVRTPELKGLILQALQISD